MANKKVETKRSRQYTAKEREAALASVKLHGVSEAARKHGIPMKTVWNWARRGKGEAPPLAVTEVGGAEDVSSESDEDGAPAESATGSDGTSLNAPEARESGVGGAKRAQRRYTPSEKAAILEHARLRGPTAASKKFGVSRFSVYEWQRQAKRAAAGEGPSPTSGPAPNDVAEQRDREILNEWHRHPGLGPSQVRNQLRRRGIKAAVQTVRRVMEEDGYRPPKVQRSRHDQRFEAVRPNHLWHLDYVQRFVNKTSVFTLILLDDCSRFVVAHGVDDRERSDMVLETFEKAVERHGRPERVIHDKGAAFWSWRGISRFTALLTELGVDQIVCEHKEWNGKLEAFNGNLHSELFDVVHFADVGDMKRRLATHLDFYNHRRTHHALGGLLVPADRYYGRHEQVLARIEAGLPADAAHDALDLQERGLELFKVTSRGGSPEVWLLGQRLLGLRPE